MIAQMREKSAATTKHTHHKSQSHRHELVIPITFVSLFFEHCIQLNIKITSSFLDRSAAISPNASLIYHLVHVDMSVRVRDC